MIGMKKPIYLLLYSLFVTIIAEASELSDIPTFPTQISQPGIYTETDSIIIQPAGEPTMTTGNMNPDTHILSLQTNLLYDLLLIPNIGVEIPLKGQWSIGGNWMYSWWKNDSRHLYWRTYGGEIYARKYFHRLSRTSQPEKRLTGHHAGIYFQGLTYDIELGSHGYLSNFTFGTGIEYGYTMSLNRLWRMDFNLGIGYMAGKYKEYTPIDQSYVWQATKRLSMFGPTRASISLIRIIR